MRDPARVGQGLCSVGTCFERSCLHGTGTVGVGTCFERSCLHGTGTVAVLGHALRDPACVGQGL